MSYYKVSPLNAEYCSLVSNCLQTLSASTTLLGSTIAMYPSPNGCGTSHKTITNNHMTSILTWVCRSWGLDNNFSLTSSNVPLTQLKRITRGHLTNNYLYNTNFWSFLSPLTWTIHNGDVGVNFWPPSKLLIKILFWKIFNTNFCIFLTLGYVFCQLYQFDTQYDQFQLLSLLVDVKVLYKLLRLYKNKTILLYIGFH